MMHGNLDKWRFNMTGDKTIDDSYEEIKKLIKDNSTDSITIRYDKLDPETMSLLRSSIKDVLYKRKSDLWLMISKAR